MSETITRLPGRFRDTNHDAPVQAGLDVAANLLESALPVWTKITDAPDTWPEEILQNDHQIMAHGKHCTNVVDIERFVSEMIGSNYEYYTHWRPLCDLDYPPEQAT